jgi:hypothetical protein
MLLGALLQPLCVPLEHMIALGMRCGVRTCTHDPRPSSNTVLCNGSVWHALDGLAYELLSMGSRKSPSSCFCCALPGEQPEDGDPLPAEAAPEGLQGQQGRTDR